MEAKFTAGPWAAHVSGTIDGEPAEWEIRDKTDGVIAIVQDVNVADALLLASAQDMFAALQELRKQLRAHVKFDVKKHFCLMVADVAADKALRKATGD